MKNITVIVPVYNEADMLPQFIISRGHSSWTPDLTDEYLRNHFEAVQLKPSTLII